MVMVDTSWKGWSGKVRVKVRSRVMEKIRIRIKVMFR
jgi:hypothetical protein